MSPRPMTALLTALAIGALSIWPASAQTEPAAVAVAASAETAQAVEVPQATEPARAIEAKQVVDFDRDFADVKDAWTGDAESAEAFRQKLYLAGLNILGALPRGEPAEGFALASRAAHEGAQAEPAN